MNGYHSQYLKDVPQDSLADLANIYKHSLDFLRSRGSEKSIRFAARAFYGKDADVYYPQTDILKASDGKWFIEQSINVKDVKIDYSDNPKQLAGSAQTVNFINNTLTAVGSLFAVQLGVGDIITFSGNTKDYLVVNIIDNNRLVTDTHPPHVYGNNIYLKVQANTTAFGRFVNTTINGLTSNAYAVAETANPYYDAGTLITELKVSSVTRDFINGEELVATIEDEGEYKKLKANLFSGIVSRVTVTSPGSGYVEGASVPVVPVQTQLDIPANGSGAQVIISKVSRRRLEGTIKAVDVVYNSGTLEDGTDYGYYLGGAGYLANDALLFTGGGGTDAAGKVRSVLDDGTYHDPYIDVISTRISDVQDVIINASNDHEGFSYNMLANVYTNTSNLVISSGPGTLINDVTLDQWSGNSNVYFETGDVLFFYNYSSNIGYQTVTQSNLYDEYLTLDPGIPGGETNLHFQVVKKANANSKISESMFYWTYGPCGPIISTQMLNAGSGYIELPSVSVLSNTQIRSLGILGRMDLLEGGLGYAIGDVITFDNPAGTYGVGGNAQVSVVDANGSITEINFIAEPGLPPGGFGYQADKLPTANIHTVAGNGANIVVSAILADDAQLIARSNAIGSIAEIKIVSGGTGYETNPIIDLTTQGDGSAQAYANIVTGVYSYPGRYLDQSGQLSSYKFLQNRDYYQKYSYVIKISESMSVYRYPFLNLIHPAGTKMFGQYMFVDNNESTKQPANVVQAVVSTGVNTSNIIVDFDAASYLDSIMNYGDTTIWYNSANNTQYANVVNSPFYINGGISLNNNPNGVIYDYSPMANANMSGFMNVAGPFYYGGGVFFDGNNDIVRMNHQSSMNVSNSLALVTWFSVANTLGGSVKTLAHKMNKTNTAGYHLYVTGNTLRADINPSTVNNSIVLASNIASNTWTMAAITYDGNNVIGYVNGELSNTSGNSSAKTDSSAPLYIGSANGSNIMYGKVAVVQVFNRSLSNTEISNQFFRYRGRFGI
jgi:hypothetical protein